MTREEATQIGILIGETKGINNRLDRFNGQIKDLTKVVSTLPCQEHGVRIEHLEGCRIAVVEDKRLDRKIKAQLIGAWSTAGVAIGIAVCEMFF
jgi:uncharacterized membrane protein YqgA involved in biofilm formation